MRGGYLSQSYLDDPHIDGTKESRVIVNVIIYRRWWWLEAAVTGVNKFHDYVIGGTTLTKIIYLPMKTYPPSLIRKSPSHRKGVYLRSGTSNTSVGVFVKGIYKNFCGSDASRLSESTSRVVSSYLTLLLIPLHTFSGNKLHDIWEGGYNGIKFKIHWFVDYSGHCGDKLLQTLVIL